MADRRMVTFTEQATSFLRHAAFQLGAFAVLALRTWWRHVADSHPSALFQAANSSDLQKLQGLLNRAPRDTEALADWRVHFLEHEEMMSGWTPLMAAASGGSADCVAALLSAGADHAHSDRWGRTPLHLAASAGASALACAELLLHTGADAFVEDVKGYTPYDLVLANDSRDPRNMQLIRAVERHALFSGMIELKVLRTMGFRRVYESRWAVVTARRHHPDAERTAGQRGSFLLLTWFRNRNDFNVAGKAWLNGAEGRLEEHEGRLTLQLTLQREHEKPSDAAVVTSRDLRHSIFLRSADTDAAATAALQRLAALVHDLANSATASGASAPHIQAEAVAADEALARRLQEEEWARAAQASEAAGVQQAAEPTAPAWPGGSDAAGPSLGTNAGEADGRVSYPSVNYVRPRAPPKSAPTTLPTAIATGPVTGDENLCVICNDADAIAGFVHGDSLHRCCVPLCRRTEGCVCKSCAELYTEARGPTTCPMCRAPIEQVVLNIY